MISVSGRGQEFKLFFRQIKLNCLFCKYFTPDLTWRWQRWRSAKINRWRSIGKDQLSINRRSLNWRRAMGEVQSSKSNWRNQSAKINRRRSATSMVQNNFDFKRISIILFSYCGMAISVQRQKIMYPKNICIYMILYMGFKKSNGWRFDFRGPKLFWLREV